MKKKILYKKIKKIFLPVLVFVSFFALCFSVMYANADTLVNQDVPFIIEGTATNNNTSIDPVGNVAYLVEKRGHSEVVNGQIVDADGQDLVCIGRQVWNENWELGSISGSTGIPYDDDSIIRSADFIPVVPNRQYWTYISSGYENIVVFFYDIDFNYLSNGYFGNKLMTTPNNCFYIKFRLGSQYGVEYQNDITISLWYDDEEGYDEYYPYQLLTQVDTGTEVLRSAGNAYDVKTPNGVIVRNIGSYTFTGDEIFEVVADPGYVIVKVNLPRKLSSSYWGSLGNLLSSSLNVVTQNSIYSGSQNSISLTDSLSAGYLWISYDVYVNRENVLVGSTIYFELATPFQEQGTLYNSVLSVDDFGSIYWLDSNDELILIPQGNYITYLYNFDYAWWEPISRIFGITFKELGGKVLKFIKDGFVNLFTINHVDEVTGEVVIDAPSEICIVVFVLMGISLLLGLCYYLVNMLRRSR